MDSQDLRGAVGKLVDVLNKITGLIKAIPFTYLIIYSLYLIVGLFCCEKVICWIDSFFIVSPATTITLLGIAKTLKLCNWHKTACILPVSTQIESFIDNHIIQLTQNEVILINVCVTFIISIFLFLAYKHFFNGRKRAD